jgi:SAM-dependent methyltransferase
VTTHRQQVHEFWNDRAQYGQNAGTNDFMLKELEERVLLARIPERATVLDVGCGNGSTLIRLAREKACTGLGVDYAESLLALARNAASDYGLNEDIRFAAVDVRNLTPSLGQFPYITTQRCLINLETTEEQKRAFGAIIERLEPSGRYYMIEAFHDGNHALNELRQKLGLAPMIAPWHNRFFKLEEVLSWERSYPVAVEELSHFASTYYFLSRVVYAKLASERGEELRYDSDINRLSLDIPPIGAFGATKLIVWRRIV